MDNPSLYFMGGMYILAGLAHFWKPKVYQKIMPSYIPYHLAMVYLSGVLEVLFGVLVMLPETQAIGAWGLIAVLIGVFPANIDMTLKYKGKRKWYRFGLWVRLPIQFWLIYWAWMFV